MGISGIDSGGQTRIAHARHGPVMMDTDRAPARLPSLYTAVFPEPASCLVLRAGACSRVAAVTFRYPNVKDTVEAAVRGFR